MFYNQIDLLNPGRFLTDKVLQLLFHQHRSNLDYMKTQWQIADPEDSNSQEDSLQQEALNRNRYRIYQHRMEYSMTHFVLVCCSNRSQAYRLSDQDFLEDNNDQQGIHNQ